MITIVFAVSLLFAAQICEAEKVSDYIPPPYSERCQISLFTLGPLAGLVGAISFFALRRFDPSATHWVAIGVLVITISLWTLGAMVAATDSLNDELWNPSLAGSLYLAFIPALRLFAFSRKVAWPRRLAFSFALSVACFYPIEFLSFVWQEWGMHIGLRTTW